MKRSLLCVAFSGTLLCAATAGAAGCKNVDPGE
jgi:hypothetical protein